MAIRRGEIYWVDWSPGRGSEQAGTRPALIVQNDLGNQNSTTTVVVAVSTSFKKVYPFQVLIPAGEGGLREDSVAKCEQILTIDQTRLGNRIGEIGPERMAEIGLALKRSLQLR